MVLVTVQQATNAKNETNALWCGFNSVSKCDNLCVCLCCAKVISRLQILPCFCNWLWILPPQRNIRHYKGYINDINPINLQNLLTNVTMLINQWWIQDFPDSSIHLKEQKEGCGENLLFGQLLPKLLENEEFTVRRCHASWFHHLYPPLPIHLSSKVLKRCDQ